MHLSIVDPGQENAVVWEGDAYPAINQNNPNSTWIDFELGNYDLKADDV